MKRYIFPLVLVLVIAAGFLGVAGYQCWQIVSADIARSSPKVMEQKKAQYDAAVKAAALDPTQALSWKAAAWTWPSSSSTFYAAPVSFTEKFRYDTPDGFPILSDTANWNNAKLKTVYAELIKNKHGTEIKQLDAIFICSKAVKFDHDADGEFIRDQRSVSLAYRLPGLLSTPGVFSTKVQTLTIQMAEPEGKGAATQLAYILSHEYGHFFHYTHQEQSAGKLDRTLPAAQAKMLNSSYPWTKEEIEANDFATIMGSPDSYQKTALPDVKQRLAADLKAGKFGQKYYSTAGQVYGILNYLAFTMYTPASQSKGLAAAYYQFLDNPPAPPTIPAKLPKLSISGKGKTYTVSWTRPWTDKKVYYVLLCTSPEVDTKLNGTLFEGGTWHQFVCSRWGNEKASATIGKVSQTKGNKIYWYDDQLPRGTKTFRVYAVLPGNMIVVSDPLTYKFK